MIYEDEREVQESRIPLYEGMLHTQTLAPILAARRNAMEVAGVSVVESETIATEAIADLDPIERQLTRAAKALEENKTRTPPRRWRWPWSAASNSASARRTRRWPRPATRSGWRGGRWKRTTPPRPWSTWPSPGQRLRLYREVLSQDQRQEVDQMLQRDRSTGGPAPPGGDPARHPRRAGPPGQHGDALVG